MVAAILVPALKTNRWTWLNFLLLRRAILTGSRQISTNIDRQSRNRHQHWRKVCFARTVAQKGFRFTTNNEKSMIMEQRPKLFCFLRRIGQAAPNVNVIYVLTYVRGTRDAWSTHGLTSFYSEHSYRFNAWWYFVNTFSFSLSIMLLWNIIVCIMCACVCRVKSCRFARFTCLMQSVYNRVVCVLPLNS